MLQLTMILEKISVEIHPGFFGGKKPTLKTQTTPAFSDHLYSIIASILCQKKDFVRHVRKIELCKEGKDFGHTTMFS